MLTPEEKTIQDHLIDLQSKDELHGMYKNIPSAVYHHPDTPGVSNSNFDPINRSYRHYMKALDDGREERNELDFRDKFFIGHAFHMLVLEPHLFEKTFCCQIIGPEEPKFDKRTTVGKNGYADWHKTVYMPWAEDVLAKWNIENQGKVVMPIKTWEQIQAMGKAFLSNAQIKSILDSSIKEVTFFWKDERTGITCKCRPDALNLDFSPDYGIIFDAKSTEDASRNGFRKSIVKFNYDRQSAFYTDGVFAVTGKKCHFIFGAQEKSDLFLNQAFMANDAMKEVGKDLYRRGLDKLHRIHKSEEVKGYSEEIEDIDLPSYAYDLDAR